MYTMSHLLRSLLIAWYLLHRGLSESLFKRDKVCATESNNNALDGTYEWLYWDENVNGSAYYNPAINQYLFPIILESTYYYRIYSTINSTTTPNAYCQIDNPPTEYVFNVHDCFNKWSDPNLIIVNCQDVCVSGNFYPQFDGTYHWLLFYPAGNTSVYYHISAAGSVFYLYGSTQNSGVDYDWNIDTSYNDKSTFSYCRVGTNLGNYLFINVEDCINSAGNVIWKTYDWDNSPFQWIADDMQLYKCNYSTTSTPTTSFPTTISPTEVPSTIGPSTSSPTTASPVTQLPTTALPTTNFPTTDFPTTTLPTTNFPTTNSPSSYTSSSTIIPVTIATMRTILLTTTFTPDNNVEAMSTIAKTPVSSDSNMLTVFIIIACVAILFLWLIISGLIFAICKKPKTTNTMQMIMMQKETKTSELPQRVTPMSDHELTVPSKTDDGNTCINEISIRKNRKGEVDIIDEDIEDMYVQTQQTIGMTPMQHEHDTSDEDFYDQTETQQTIGASETTRGD